MNEKTFDPANARRLNDPRRLSWTPPGEVSSRLGLKPGMTVADIGAGTGFFALPFARAIAPGGVVWAVDAQPAMLKLLEEELQHSGLRGAVRPLAGDAARTGLPDGSCDVAFLANIWHEVDDPRLVQAEMRRILRTGGRIAILDWRPGVEQPPGPPLDHRIAPHEAEALLKAAGWREITSSLLGPYSYLLLAST